MEQAQDTQQELQDYENQHIVNLIALTATIQTLYFRHINKILLRTYGLIRWPDPEIQFSIDKVPVVKKLVHEAVNEMVGELEVSAIKSIRKEWEFSNRKNDNWFTRLIGGRKLPANYTDAFFLHNEGALTQFIERKRGGLTLSERIWNTKPQILAEIESTLQIGIMEGQSAVRMATMLKNNLNDPNRLFRRVRDKFGKLQLSKEAAKYHPGQGKYRSSFQNALRLASTETNMAYRAADCERWQRTEFILGFEVKLSNRHITPDVCNSLAGKYPKDFKYKCWHSRCLCFAVPIRPSEEVMGRYFDAIMEGEKFEFTGHVKNVPEGMTNWLTDNQDRIKNWKHKPFFMVDNAGYTAIGK
jgi:hypothetical protein